MTTTQQRAEGLDTSTFWGVPITGYENAGRQQFVLLLMAGLAPQSKVVDVGCGTLRAGYWLIHFLDPHGYCGIEPHTGRLEQGRSSILEPGLEGIKQPRFDTNANFDTGVFGGKFDFFLAYSIWSHASKPQIETMLDHFVRDSNPGAVFLASVHPAGWLQRDYRGTEWFGTSHESDVAGCIRHRLSWIEAQCRRRGLRMRKLGREIDGQTWLEISRDALSKLRFRSIWAKPLWRRVLDSVKRRYRR